MNPSLFTSPDATPLAARMRPRTLEEYVGQESILGQGRALRRAIESDAVPSMILWGPPGTGKTTLAEVIARSTGAHFERLSAVSAGVADLRRVVAEAQTRARVGKRTVLFVDEIHRFNKAQQDAVLPYVEDGTIALIGATTENPSFEVNSALLSRARVFVLNQLSDDEIATIVDRALADTRTRTRHERRRSRRRRARHADQSLQRRRARRAQRARVRRRLGTAARRAQARRRRDDPRSDAKARIDATTRAAKPITT